MSVFTKHWKIPVPEPAQKTVAPAEVQERVISNDDHCKMGHAWGGIVPVIDKHIHSEQNKELIGKPCDCGKFVYNEGMCWCPGVRDWEIKLIENNRYV
jgi:hypothetical protein